MSRPSQSGASDDELAMAEQQQGQRSEDVATQSPGGMRTTVRIKGCVQEPLPPTPRWESADRRRVVLETEPTKSNLARAHTLQGVAERLRQRVYTEAHQLARLQEEVDSATGDRALDAARLWYLEHSFQRRLRHHLQLVFREMHHLLEARDHFDADAVLKETGGPALRLLEDLPSESSPPCAPAAPALPAASTTSGHQPLGDRDRVDSDGWTAADMAALDQEVSEAEEACAEALTSSGDSSRAEVAAAMATTARGGGGRRGRPGGPERRFSPVQWSRDRFEKKRHKDNSGSSDDTSGSKGSAGNDSLTDPAGASEAAPVDSLIADVDESEVRQSLEVFCELQRQFQQLADTLRQHALIADGVLTKADKRRLAGGAAEGAEVQEERPPPRQELLMHDVALVHSEMQRVQACVRGSEASLRGIVSALPPAPTMVWLPPTPPLRTPRRGLGWFSAILKKRFSSRK